MAGSADVISGQVIAWGDLLLLLLLNGVLFASFILAKDFRKDTTEFESWAAGQETAEVIGEMRMTGEESEVV